MKRSAALAGVAGLAFGATLPAPARAAAPRIRVGFDPIDAECNLFVGVANGTFARAGLDVEAQPMKNGAASAAAVLGGSLDAGGINVSSFLAAAQRKLPFVLVATGEMYTTAAPTAALLVPKDSPLATARDLGGKTVAVNLINGLGHLGARTWIDKNGGDSRAVRWVEMPFAAMPAALEARRVDAIMAVEPALGVAAPQARIFAQAYDAIAPRFLIGGWVATRDWAAANADAVRRFNAAIRVASAWCNGHRAESAEILGRITHVDVAAIRTMTRATFSERESPAALLQPVIDAAAKYGIVSAMPAADLLSRQALQ